MRTRRRRANDFMKVGSLSECPNCKETKPQHRVCPFCGYYKGKEVVALEEASANAG